MTIWEIVLPPLLGTLGGLIGYFSGKGKSEVEIRKLKAEAKKTEIENDEKQFEVSEKLIDFYRSEMNEMLETVNKLNVKVTELSKKVDELTQVVQTQNENIEAKDRYINELVSKIEKTETKLKSMVLASRECIYKNDSSKLCETIKILDKDAKSSD